MNAIDLPSSEKAGAISPMMLSGGSVTACLRPSRKPMSTMRKGPPTESLSDVASHCPSGDQSRSRPTDSMRDEKRSAILPWTPPDAFARKTAVSFGPVRSHAICVPSGDHVGLRSSARSVVKRVGWLPPRTCTKTSIFSPVSPAAE